MTNQFSLVTSKIFENNQADFYSDNESYFMTVNQLATCLGYASKTGIDLLIKRNEYLKSDEFSATFKLKATDGKSYNTRLFNEDGIYEIAFLSKTAVAQMFRAWVRKILKELRQQAKQSQQLTTTNPLLEQNIINLKQSQSQLIEDTLENSYHLGELRDRLETVESQSTSYISDKNYMLHPVYQQIFSSLVRLDRRYHQLKQENKAIRTELMLHHKEHNPEAYSKPKSNKSSKYPAKHTVTYFNSMECLFNDMKDTYQSFITNQTIQSGSNEPMIISTLIFRLVEIYEDHLHFQVNGHNKACMDVFGITKAEKRIVDCHGVAEYKVYYDGGVEPVVFQAVPKRR